MGSSGASHRRAVLWCTRFVLVVALILAGVAPVAASPDCDVEGTDDADVLYGGPGNDVICGRGGSDTIHGRGGADRLIGGPGMDALHGGPGDDVLSGGDGADRFDGGSGDDSFKGGSQSDSADFARARNGVKVVLPDGVATGQGADTLAGIEAVVGSAYADELVGGVAANRLSGGDGDDVVRGRGGDDVLVGGAGDDRLRGGDGDDALRGQSDDDFLDGGNGRNTCVGGRGVDILKPTCDSEPPRMQSLALSPTVVDTSESGVWVTATINVSDDLSGVRYGVIWLRSPSGAQSQGVSWSSGDLYSGDHLNRVYELHILMPRYSEQGTWVVSSVEIYDTVGNRLRLDAEDLQERVGDVTLQQSGAGDMTAPRIAALAISPDVIDTSAGSATVAIDVRLRDDLSGVDWGTVQFDGPSGQEATAWFYPEKRISGDATDGVYRYDLILPRFSAKGLWTVKQVNLRDAAGNYRHVGPTALENAGFDTKFSLAGADDTRTPKLESLSISPSTIDTADAPATVVLRARITDNVSGFSHGTLSVSSSTGGQRHDVFLDHDNRVSGDANDGVYRAMITIPRYAARGWWTSSAADLWDSAGNRLDIQLSSDVARFFNGS